MVTNMQGHTPGPWKWGKGVEDDPTRCFVTQGIPGRAEFLIAEIQNGAPGDCLETEVANAHLIAAAPDLLAALKDLVESLNNDLDDKQAAAWDAGRAAIAKAEGQA